MATEIRAFGLWPIDQIKVEDPGLVRYMTLEPRFVPKTGARYAGQRFHKSKIFIVERFINKLMVPGHIKKHKHYRSSGTCTGKSTTMYQAVLDAFKMIEQKTKKNPLTVFVKAVENAAPREEIVTIEYGGARYPKAVECAPQRRVDVAIKHMVWGIYGKRFNTKKTVEESIAEEILACYAQDAAKSNSIAKKLEMERQADASR